MLEGLSASPLQKRNGLKDLQNHLQNGLKRRLSSSTTLFRSGLTLSRGSGRPWLRFRGLGSLETTWSKQKGSRCGSELCRRGFGFFRSRTRGGARQAGASGSASAAGLTSDTPGGSKLLKRADTCEKDTQSI